MARDVHMENAVRIWGGTPDADHRRVAKNLNFAMSYGAKAEKVATMAGITLQEAHVLIQYVSSTFHVAMDWGDDQIVQAKEQGYVTTIGGRRCYFPQSRESDFMDKQMRNAPIQGTAADMLKYGMVCVDHALREGGYRAQIVLPVHDELVVEAPDEEVEAVSTLVEKEMERAGIFYIQAVPTPVDVQIGQCWRK